MGSGSDPRKVSSLGSALTQEIRHIFSHQKKKTWSFQACSSVISILRAKPAVNGGTLPPLYPQSFRWPKLQSAEHTSAQIRRPLLNTNLGSISLCCVFGGKRLISTSKKPISGKPIIQMFYSMVKIPGKSYKRRTSRPIKTVSRDSYPGASDRESRVLP